MQAILQIHGDIYDYLIKLTLHDTYKTYGIQSIRLMQFYYEKSQKGTYFNDVTRFGVGRVEQNMTKSDLGGVEGVLRK